MTKHLSGLNAKQKEAAMHKDGPLLIVAGAGAGKTKTITHRIVNLISSGIAPDKILAVTFTNKAAKEMRERISLAIKDNLVGNSDSVPFVSTFHSLGVHIIKENARILGLTKYFSILDEQDATRLIKESLKELNLDPKQYEPRKIRNIISKEKGKFTHLSDYLEQNNDTEGRGKGYLGEIVARVWHLYEKKKSQEQALDFDDLLLKTTKLLQDNKEIRKKYQEKWTHIHVDEYQDTNEVQYLMTKLLSENNKNICVVGDADQNIYSWRGANLKNILSFEKDYPNTKIILLEENYRSTKNILEAANEIIKKNKYRPDKNLFTDNGVGEKIGFYEALDESDEADFVATKILELADSASSNFSSLPEVTILYRANFQSRVLEEAMLRYNIPYQVLGVKFFERKEVKDTLAYLRAALNPESLSDIKRIINFPARGIGKVTLAKIFANDTEKLPIKMKIKINNFYKLLEEIKEKIISEKASAVIKFVMKKSGIENELMNGTEEDLERLANIKELVTLALKYDEQVNTKENISGIERLLEDAALASDQDSLIISERGESSLKNTDAIKLMTVHASKGLEFEYVFIVGLEDGLFPNQRDGEVKSNEDAEEERRLFYVALTRAKKKIFLCFANFRTIFGSRNINTPSEFISDIPVDLLEKEGEDSGIKTIYI
ncbi:ATP-dependent DNA helicase PcrA [Candidatus Nomurabacteria bacterium CG10_big_fil_rev_8_21_14_0_10_35_16]|uniref:DNA 3'-5' helicase n=1 Tax=Candidatus Nomurabacteria bacterium CG10_big_fil_rev_8_21_14_0_10_35_16 TaxID=1974731 RepID=A0A2H0TBE5_9BACT|nr:MAG: ATP-dependent DNA helicase PcrA [Candidatus Nomurabacteria bacterium CG10_big_fil_rev_8_21_14_0_10_35_16]